MPRSFWRQPANALTALRLCCVPAVVVTIAAGHAVATAVLFGLAVVTDFADGRVARQRGEASARGALFDHTVDAVFVATLLAALAWRGDLTIWLPVLVIASFAQYAWDSDALRGQRLRASRIGRSNGIAYYVAAGVPVVRDALGLGWPHDTAVQAFAWILVATTLVSMLDRAWAFLRLPR